MRRYKGFLMLTVLAAVAAVVVGYFGWTAWKQHLHDHVDRSVRRRRRAFPTNNVQVLGMKVGSVTKVTRRPATWKWNSPSTKDVKIPADAQAVTLQTSIPVGPGRGTDSGLPWGPVMADHTTIGLKRTKTPGRIHPDPRHGRPPDDLARWRRQGQRRGSDAGGLLRGDGVRERRTDQVRAQ